MKVSDFLMLREFATTLYARSRNDWTTPAPMPCEAPVTMTVFCLLAISASLAGWLRLKMMQSRRLLLEIPLLCFHNVQQQLAIDSQEGKLFKFRRSGNIHVRPNSLLALPRHR